MIVLRAGPFLTSLVWLGKAQTRTLTSPTDGRGLITINCREEGELFITLFYNDVF